VPDRFTACARWDRSPFVGEQSILLLSKAQGKYDRFVIPVTAYSHGAAVGDVNGDGYRDILLLDSSHNKYFFLINQGGTGTFVRDDTRLPADPSNTSYFSTELTDVDGDGISTFSLRDSTRAMRTKARPRSSRAHRTEPSRVMRR
jgi:hypothetical protein